MSFSFDSFLGHLAEGYGLRENARAEDRKLADSIRSELLPHQLNVVTGLAHAVLYVFVLPPLINALGHWRGSKNFDNTANNWRLLSWVTGGESAELALALWVAGQPGRAARVLRSIGHLRAADATAEAVEGLRVRVHVEARRAVLMERAESDQAAALAPQPQERPS